MGREHPIRQWSPRGQGPAMNVKPLSSTCSRGCSGNSLHAEPTIQPLPGLVQSTFSGFSSPHLQLHSMLVVQSLPFLFGMPSLVSQLSLASSLLPAIPPCSGCVPALLKFLQWFPFERRSKLPGMAYQALWGYPTPLYSLISSCISPASRPLLLPQTEVLCPSFFTVITPSFWHIPSRSTNCQGDSGASPLDWAV